MVCDADYVDFRLIRMLILTDTLMLISQTKLTLTVTLTLTDTVRSPHNPHTIGANLTDVIQIIC